jgi:hypothetical protein
VGSVLEGDLSPGNRAKKKGPLKTYCWEDQFSVTIRVTLRCHLEVSVHTDVTKLELFTDSAEWV